MAKAIAESTNRLSISWLKKHDYINKDYSYRSGGIKWTSSWGKENSISFSVIKENRGTPDETAYIELRYTNTNNRTQEKTDMNYKIPLVTTSCNYGGKRYWFKCSLYRNGVYCGRRVGVIYGSAGNYFGCRKCANIAYQAQFEGGRFRIGITEPDVEKAFHEIKREFYRGKPTRRYKRYLRLREKMDNAWAMAAIRFGMKF